MLKKREGPYLMTYRVNAGFIPKSSWVHEPDDGGGRIIGECCHFFDLFNYIVDSEIKVTGSDKTFSLYNAQFTGAEASPARESASSTFSSRVIA